MRMLSIVLPLLLCNTFAACGDDGSAVPDAPSGPTMISITSDHVPALVAFRDGIDAAWQSASMKSPTSFEIEVNGPYMVTVVCEDPTNGGTYIWQAARTPEDAHDVALECVLTLPSGHAVTGHMVQAGSVYLAESIDTRDYADWDFQLVAPNGTYDLVAVTDDRIAIRRAITIDGDLAVTPQVDVAQQGTALVDVGFTIANAEPDETLVAAVFLETQTSSVPATVYHGPIAMARVVPSSAFVATDIQAASMRAINGPALRALRRPFRAGDNTEYILPPPLGGVQWAIESDNLSASWMTLPELDLLMANVYGWATDSVRVSIHNVKMTARFVATTGITRLTLDTDIPGYKPEWKVDFTGPYIRELFAQRTVNGETSTSLVSERLNDRPLSGKVTSRTSRSFERGLAPPMRRW
jgi:hypothetical protein